MKGRHARGPGRRALVMGRLIGAALVGGILSGGWWVANSPLFDMKSLQVTGNVHLSSRQVARLAGLDSATNVLWVSSRSVQEGLEQSPWVSAVHISRVLPSTLKVQLRERVPAAVLSDGTLVAADGTVLGRAGARSPRLPEIMGAVRHALRPGARALAASSALSVLRALPPPLVRCLEGVSLAPDARLTLFLRGGGRALMGPAVDLPHKGAVLQALLSWAKQAGVDPGYFDVRAPSAPALEPRAQTPPLPARSAAPASPGVRGAGTASPGRPSAR